MITVQELRIGNWVQRPESVRIDILDDGKIYWLVDSLMIRDCEYYNDNWAFEPIPLTPEILEKCGFKKNSEYFTNHLTDGDIESVTGAILYIQMYSNNIFEFVTCSDTYNGHSIQIKYLHQLQNLYFSLTGEELTFKP